MIRPPSPSRGEALCTCPLCGPEREEQARALVGHDEDHRGHRASYVESFTCPEGHTLADLTPKAEGEVLADALDWLHDAMEALESAADDAAYDRWRDDGY